MHLDQLLTSIFMGLALSLSCTYILCVSLQDEDMASAHMGTYLTHAKGSFLGGYRGVTHTYIHSKWPNHREEGRLLGKWR